MKRFQLVVIALLAISIQTEAQHYRLHGLEIYNPHLINPAFTGSDKLVQADYLRQSNWSYIGNKASIMTTLPGRKRFCWHQCTDFTQRARYTDDGGVRAGMTIRFTDSLIFNSGFKITCIYRLKTI